MAPSRLSTTDAPIWLTAQDWLESAYRRDWDPDGVCHVLFDLNQNYGDDAFPIFPAAELMVRVQDGWAYQPYECPNSETLWVYVRVVDFSNKLYLPSIQQIKEKEITFYKYCRYTWTEQELNSLGIDLTIKSSDGLKCARGSVTHQELNKILEVPRLKEKWEVEQQQAARNMYYHLTEPSKETPVQLYAAGSDDSSYTRLYETLDQAMADIERFKVEGVPERPESEGWVFTN